MLIMCAKNTKVSFQLFKRLFCMLEKEVHHPKSNLAQMKINSVRSLNLMQSQICSTQNIKYTNKIETGKI